MIFSFFKGRKPSSKKADQMREEVVEERKKQADDKLESTKDSRENATSKSNDSAKSTTARNKKSEPKEPKPKKLTKAELEKIAADNAKMEQLLRGANEFAKAIAWQTADNKSDVGEYQEFKMIADGSGVHYFAANLKGYQGWRWGVVLSVLPESERVTVSESMLLPSDGALLAPDWVPFKNRLKPSDISETDELPYEQDDARLEDVQKVFELLKKEDTAVLENLALERNRVLNAYGKEDLAARWYEGTHGPFTASTRIASAQCMSCAFYIPLSGDLGQLFGACGNSWSRDDGRVVSADHGCGMHSETDATYKSRRWNPEASVIDQVEGIVAPLRSVASQGDESDSTPDELEDGADESEQGSAQEIIEDSAQDAPQ